MQGRPLTINLESATSLCCGAKYFPTLWRLSRETVFSVFAFVPRHFVGKVHISVVANLLTFSRHFSMDSSEILRMNRLLEVEALSFQLQLEDAVSILDLNISFFFFFFFFSSQVLNFGTESDPSILSFLVSGLFGYKSDSGGGRSRPCQLREANRRHPVPSGSTGPCPAQQAAPCRLQH